MDSSKIRQRRELAMLMLIIFLQIVVLISIILNLSIARQVVGFIYFTFIPGHLILRFSSIDLDDVELILLSIGLSIMFLMTAGLFMNGLITIIGFSKPLSLTYLLVVFNLLILAGCVLIHKKKPHPSSNLIKSSKIPVSIFLFISLPVLSLLGVTWVNIFNSNLILLFVILLITLSFALVAIYKNFLPVKWYPLALYTIALSLLLHSSLVSNYLNTFASDNYVEYFVAKNTQNNLFWNSSVPANWDIGYGRTNAMLSVTILPTIYSNLLGIELYWVYKLIYPLIFSLVPLVFYKIWQPYVGEKYAFISTLLFMTQNTFYTEMLGLNRQMIAELFFSLLILILIKKNIKPSNRVFYFTALGFALVISHYGIAEIFLAFIVFVWVSLTLLKKPSRVVKMSMVVFFCVIMFLWYIFTCNSATFKSLLSFSEYVYEQLDDFLNPASRGTMVLRGLGLEPPPTIWNTISRAFAYLTEIFIALGFIGLSIKRVNVPFEREQILFISASMTILGALILIPGLANTMNMTRFYHVLLLFLAPLYPIGAEFILRMTFKHIKKLSSSILLLIILIPYFLFQVGFAYEIVGVKNWSLPFSKHRADPLQLYVSFGYIDTESVYGAQWLRENMKFEGNRIYSDIVCRRGVLSVYGEFYEGNIESLSNTTIIQENQIVYLNKLNVIHQMIVEIDFSWNVTELYFLGNLDVVYNNGGSMCFMSNP